jgi:hypothetical protein
MNLRPPIATLINRKRKKSWDAQLKAATAPMLFKDELLDQAMADARDILRWREPRVKEWRVCRLALALMEEERRRARSHIAAGSSPDEGSDLR